MEKKHRPLDGFYHKIMTPSNARKAKSALPMPLREANTSDAALMKNKKIKRKNKNKKNKNKNKEAHACDVIFQTDLWAGLQDHGPQSMSLLASAAISSMIQYLTNAQGW